MAVFKKHKGKRINPGDPNWDKGRWYVWRRINGKIIHKSIPEATTRKQAEHVERRYIEQLYNQRYGIADNSTTFKSFAEGPYTRYTQQRNVNLVAKDLYVRLLVRRFGNVPLTEITPQDCRDAQHYFKTTKAIRTDRMSPSSVNRIMSTLSRLFSLACEEGILDRNPMQYVKMLKEPPPRARLLTEKEKERLWEELKKDTLLMRIVILATNLPLRRGQLLDIRPELIDWNASLLTATASKGRASRVIPLNDISRNTLRAMQADSQLPFPLKSFRKRWAKVTIAAGINKENAKRGENFTFHDLRTLQATEYIKNNVNPHIVQQLFGHSSMGITDRYIGEDMHAMKEAVKSLDVQPTTESDIVQ